MSKKQKKEVIILSGKAAFINSANKLNKSMPEISRGCGAMGDKKYNRNKNKKAIRREIENSRDGFFNYSTSAYLLTSFHKDNFFSRYFKTTLFI
ncbi:hypothetical protein [Alkaliphilus serpentinus]|uniref:Uncharacterized protein n=1 Tax=Alkaliphilus serpentinus TaxID=1482731 RepID=A0A833HQ75_9FIRM|nr:hypothetical protein [Alkaliphilus serpentinus]KAB3531543.1 hypothetical protein F8153_05040 [Alkaliphilus serpentinus]